jgi:hypothetical protein
MGDDMTYEEWLKAVDVIVTNWVGVSLDDLPDWLSRDAYTEGLDPEEAAEEALLQIGYYNWEEELAECDAD